MRRATVIIYLAVFRLCLSMELGLCISRATPLSTTSRITGQTFKSVAMDTLDEL